MPVEPRIARARALIGTRFRLHGRDSATGVDCVGLIVLACGVDDPPTGYALRGGTAARWSAIMDSKFFRRRGALRAGDALLLDAGAGQFHLGLWTGDGLIHADAGLRRVVEMPGALRWPLVGIWGRIKGKR